MIKQVIWLTKSYQLAKHQVSIVYTLRHMVGGHFETQFGIEGPCH